MGCVLVCSLTSKLHAQSTATNGPNTGLTAAQRAAAAAAQYEALIQAMDQALAQSQAARSARPHSAAGQSGAQQSLIIGGQQDQFSNNLASVSEWLHDSVTNVDGTPADSM